MIFGLEIMPQKQNPHEVRAARVAKKLFIFKLFELEDFSKNLYKVLKHIINLKKF
jgi:hypothetical protein